MATIEGVRFNLLERFFGINSHGLPTARASISGTEDFTAIAMNAAAASGSVHFVDNNGAKTFPPMVGAGTTTQMAIAEALAGLQIARIPMVKGFADGDILTVADGAATWVTPPVYATEDTTDEWLDYCFGVADFTPPSNLYAGVLQAGTFSASGAGSYTEVTNTGYARVAVNGIWEVIYSSDLVGEFYRARTTSPVTFAPVSPGWTAPPAAIALFDSSGTGTGRIYGLIGPAGGSSSVDGSGNLVIASNGLALQLENIFAGGTRFLNWFSVQPTSIASGDVSVESGAVTNWLDHARGPDGRLLIALANAGALTVRRYDDSVPDAFVAATSIDSATVPSCSLGARQDGSLDLLYCHNGAVKHRVSTDQGVTFSVASTIASGYDCVAHHLDARDGMMVAMLWKTNNWYVSVGTLDTAGTTWTFTTPALVVAGKRAGASIGRRADGTWEFAYITSGGAASVIRCPTLSTTGSGTWA